MNIPELVGNRRPITLRPVAEREGAITAYRTILVGILREIQREVERTVLPAYASAEPVTDTMLVKDDGESAWLDALKAIIAFAAAGAVDAVQALFLRESSSHARRFASSIKRATRIDVPERVMTPAVEHDRLIRTYVERNAALITSLGTEAVGRVEQMVYEARLSPRAARPTARALRLRIREGLQVSRRRAELIAYDQLASLNSDLARMRQTATGFEQYAWNARLDGKTRPLHVQLHGQVFKWSDVGPAEGGAHAGKAIRCRCVPVAYMPGQSDPLAGRRNVVQ